MPNEKNNAMEKMIRPESYHRIYEVRAAEPKEGDDPKAMIVEGKAITFNDETFLFRDNWAGKDVYEKIDSHALEGADMNDVFLKYNHSDQIMVMARTKNRSLTLIPNPDGLHIRAELANTSAGRDLYELVRRGDIDKMSFAFSIEQERSDETDERITYTVMKIRKLYDVAAVPLPAYDNTQMYARRLGDVESHRTEVETKKKAELELMRRRAMLK